MATGEAAGVTAACHAYDGSLDAAEVRWIFAGQDAFQAQGRREGPA